MDEKKFRLEPFVVVQEKTTGDRSLVKLNYAKKLVKKGNYRIISKEGQKDFKTKLKMDR